MVSLFYSRRMDKRDSRRREKTKSRRETSWTVKIIFRTYECEFKVYQSVRGLGFDSNTRYIYFYLRVEPGKSFPYNISQFTYFEIPQGALDHILIACNMAKKRKREKTYNLTGRKRSVTPFLFFFALLGGDSVTKFMWARFDRQFFTFWLWLNFFFLDKLNIINILFWRAVLAKD